jgi:pimeloyl-ACP methyl ester carboxylesterase
LVIDNKKNVRYLMSEQDDRQRGIIVFFHGNGCLASDMSVVMSEAQKANMACALVEYPGYADSQTPSEAKILKSSLACFDHIKRKNKHLSSKQVVVFGQSLGTCVATYVASMRRVSKVVLVSCFPSIARVANLKVVEGLLANKFRAELWAKKVKAPVLAVHAELDALISKAVFDEQVANFVASPSIRSVIVKSQTHNSVLASKDFWKVFHDFAGS